MGTVAELDDLAALVQELDRGGDEQPYVRWSRGPVADRAVDERNQSSRDALTGIPLPGLSANPLRIEPWWVDRSIRLWVARRLYDYCHLRELRGPGVRAWILVGEQCGRGPDNEPLVICRRPVAWVSDDTLRECEEEVRRQESGEWGPLNRAS